jgi:TRAP-type C4-dicarboxylate transport system substrate-binding protein
VSSRGESGADPGAGDLHRSEQGGGFLRQHDQLRDVPLLQVAKHFTKLDHIFALATWIVDAKWWARLPKADQDAIEEAAAEIQPLIPQLLAKTDNEALAKAKAAGSEVIIITDKAPWQKLMSPVWDQNSAKVPGGKELITAIGAL